MEVEFRRSFEKDLSKLRDKGMLTKIKEVILEVKDAETLEDVSNVKKLKADGEYYRIRVGDYRIGILLNEDIAPIPTARPNLRDRSLKINSKGFSENP